MIFRHPHAAVVSAQNLPQWFARLLRPLLFLLMSPAAVSAAVVSALSRCPAASAAASTAAPILLHNDFLISGLPLIYPLRAFYHQPAGSLRLDHSGNGSTVVPLD